MIRLFVPAVAASLLLSACAYHRLVVPNPDPGSEMKQADSTALGWGAAQRRTVADCPTNLIDEVRFRQSFVESLVTVLTLGLVAPAQVQYACRKLDTEEGTTEGTTEAPSAPEG